MPDLLADQSVVHCHLGGVTRMGRAGHALDQRSPGPRPGAESPPARDQRRQRDPGRDARCEGRHRNCLMRRAAEIPRRRIARAMHAADRGPASTRSRRSSCTNSAVTARQAPAYTPIVASGAHACAALRRERRRVADGDLRDRRRLRARRLRFGYHANFPVNGRSVLAARSLRARARRADRRDRGSQARAPWIAPTMRQSSARERVRRFEAAGRQRRAGLEPRAIASSTCTARPLARSRRPRRGEYKRQGGCARARAGMVLTVEPAATCGGPGVRAFRRHRHTHEMMLW